MTLHEYLNAPITLPRKTLLLGFAGQCVGSFVGGAIKGAALRAEANRIINAEVHKVSVLKDSCLDLMETASPEQIQRLQGRLDFLDIIQQLD